MEHVPTEVNPFVSANTVSCGIPMQWNSVFPKKLTGNLYSC
jgi:hypothetical protein